MRSRLRLPASFSRKAARIEVIIEVGKRVAGNFAEHRMPTFAAALAYRALFGLFPFMLLFVVLVGIFGPPDAFGQLVEEVKSQSLEQVPKQLEPVVEQGREQIQPLEDMAGRAQKQADGELLLLGIGVALWSISALASTLADAFNIAYGLTETRPWWKAQALSLAFGPIVVLAVTFAVVLMLTGSRVVEGVAGTFGMRDLYVLLWSWLHYPVALVLLWAALSVAYLPLQPDCYAALEGGDAGRRARRGRLGSRLRRVLHLPGELRRLRRDVREPRSGCGTARLPQPLGGDRAGWRRAERGDAPFGREQDHPRRKDRRCLNRGWLYEG